MKRNTIADLLAKGIRNENGCLIWQGALSHNGYAVGSLGGRQGRIHRFIWEHYEGTIPPGINILHKCDTRACFAYEHLFAGTQLDNIRDMMSKGRDNNRVGRSWEAEGRERASEAAKARWAAMTDLERSALGARFSSVRLGKRRGPYGGRSEYAKGYIPRSA